SAVDLSYNIVQWYPHVFEKHFIELGLAGHLLEWSNGDAWTMHVYQHVSQALVFWRLGVGSNNAEAVVCEMAETGPGLLAIDYERVAIEHGLRTECRKVRSRVGLGVALAPDLIGTEDSG